MEPGAAEVTLDGWGDVEVFLNESVDFFAVGIVGDTVETVRLVFWDGEGQDRCCEKRKVQK